MVADLLSYAHRLYAQMNPSASDRKLDQAKKSSKSVTSIIGEEISGFFVHGLSVQEEGEMVGIKDMVSGAKRKVLVSPISEIAFMS